MQNPNFSPEYNKHIKESLQEIFYVKNAEEIVVLDNTELLNFLIE